MSILKNRKIATIIAAIAIVAATMLGTTVSLNRASAKVEDMFYDGVYLENGGYMQPGIESHLEKRIEVSLGIWAIVDEYDELKTELAAFRAARESLINAGNPAQKGRGNDELQLAFTVLRDALAKIDLPERDVADLEKLFSTFNGAQTAILGSGYNLEVMEFMDGTLGAFPVVILKRFIPVRAPQLF